MWLELFVISGGGNVWFWLLVVFLAGILLASAREENGFMSFLAIATFVLSMLLFGDFNIFQYIYHNPLWLLVFLSSYIFVGTFWSMLKWKCFTSVAHDRYQELKRQFIKSNGISGENIPDDKKPYFVQYLKDAYVASWQWQQQQHYLVICDLNDVIPKASDNKDKIIFWMSCWPSSVLWSIFHDLIEKTFRLIFEHLKKVYQSIAMSSFRNSKSDF